MPAASGAEECRSRAPSFPAGSPPVPPGRRPFSSGKNRLSPDQRPEGSAEEDRRPTCCSGLPAIRRSIAWPLPRSGPPERIAWNRIPSKDRERGSPPRRFRNFPSDRRRICGTARRRSPRRKSGKSRGSTGRHPGRLGRRRRPPGSAGSDRRHRRQSHRAPRGRTRRCAPRAAGCPVAPPRSPAPAGSTVPAGMRPSFAT